MEDAEILEKGLDNLRQLLGDDWQVTFPNRPLRDGERIPEPGPPGESVVYVVAPSNVGGGSGQVFVAARPDLSPLQARSEFQAKLALMHSLIGSSAVLVIAPWLSPRTREVLMELGYNYLDLTGNVSLRLHMPPVIIRTDGASNNPDRAARQHVQQLRGARAGRLVRLLADAAPPYRATELAEVSRVSLSYVSRLLDALEEEALITRDGRLIVEVDWPQLIRARASQFELLKANSYVGMVAQGGTDDVLRRLRVNWEAIEDIGPVAITGSFAARKLVPEVAVGGQLMMYAPPDPQINGAFEKISALTGLLRTKSGADVLLLRPSNNVVFERRRNVDGNPHVAISQLAIDCLSGTGRMPAEGEALVQYMESHVSEWRARNLMELAHQVP